MCVCVCVGGWVGGCVHMHICAYLLKPTALTFCCMLPAAVQVVFVRD